MNQISSPFSLRNGNVSRYAYQNSILPLVLTSCRRGASAPLFLRWFGLSFLFACLLSLTSGSTAFAQAVANAQIHGQVHDASGAVIPGAKITATQTETGHTQTTSSGSDGNYLLADLPVGGYTIEVAAPFSAPISRAVSSCRSDRTCRLTFH
jgi:hypothetical protein